MIIIIIRWGETTPKANCKVLRRERETEKKKVRETERVKESEENKMYNKSGWKIWNDHRAECVQSAENNFNKHPKWSNKH